MKKRMPYRRRPYDDEDEDEKNFEPACDEKDLNDRLNNPKKIRDRPRAIGSHYDDWFNDRRSLFRTPFEEEFEHFFDRSPFRIHDDLFRDSRGEISEMHERMDKIITKAMDGNLEKPNKGGPFVYGFSMRTGPDGVPHVQEFGNMSPEMMRKFRASHNLSLPGPGEVKTGTGNHALPSREPLTDIMEHDDHFTITLELPGVEKKDINLEIEDGALVVDVDTPVRNYFKKLPLPSEVEPKSIKASFNNGVLDVNVKRLKPKPKKGKKIKIK